MNKVHDRFNKHVFAFSTDFTSSLAKWLVHQSPYTVPDKLKECIEAFEIKIQAAFNFDPNGMVDVNLSDLHTKLYRLLEMIPEIMELNERKNGKKGNGYTSRYSTEEDPDNDFIDILKVAQNIRCDFADKADLGE